MDLHKVRILGTASYLPGKPVEFDNILKVLGEVSEAPLHIQNWVNDIQPVMKEMLGIEQSYYAIDPITREFTESNVTMAVKAAKKAIDDAGISPEDIDFISLGCQVQENMPTASVMIQDMLGIKSCAEVSIHSNCTSAYKAIMIAHDMIALGRYKTALVVSTQMSSSQYRAEFFNQQKIKRSQMLVRWFLSDGAGSMVLTRDDSLNAKGNFLEATYIESIGGGYEPFMFDNREYYAMNPKEVYENGLHHVCQEGISGKKDKSQNVVFGKVFAEGVQRMSQQFDIDLSKTKHFQVNFPARHIFQLIKEECAQIGIPDDSYYTRLYKLGYTGPPAALIALDNILKEEVLESGDQIISFVTEVSKIMQGGFMVKHY